jgi:hypothetical protein
MATNNAPQWALDLLRRVELLEARLESGSTRRRDRLPHVPLFDGNREEYRTWMAQLEGKFEVDMAEDEESVRFLYAYSRLTGRALKQISPWIKQINKDDRTMINLYRQLQDAFGTQDDSDDYSRRLMALKQGKRPFATYLADFERSLLAADGLDWPDQIKRIFLETGFSKELSTALVPVQKPSKFDDFVTVVRRVAVDLERGARRAGGGSYGASSSYGDSTADGMDWDPEPEVKISTVGIKKRAKLVSRAVLLARKKKGLCLRCGHLGHRIHACAFLEPLGLRSTSEQTDEE